MKNVRTIWLVAVVLFLCACPAPGTIEFKDGLTHNINYQIYDSVWVDYQAPSMFTTVNCLDGASIDYPCYLSGFENSRINVRGGYIYGKLYSHGSSQVDISGGSINELHSRDSSRVGISGGSIRFDLTSYDSSQVDISGGIIGGLGGLSSRDSSQVNISGGSIWDLESYDSSQISIAGGTILGDLGIHDSSRVDISGGLLRDGILHIVDSSRVNISGGSIVDDLYSYGSSQLNISGGSINGYLYSYDSSQVDISGGSIDGLRSFNFSHVNISGGSIGWLDSRDSSQVNISGGAIWGILSDDSSQVTINGLNFAVDGQPFGYGEITSILGGSLWDEPLRHLTGTLLSSELINNDFRIGYDARIVLIPEPASALLMALGTIIITLHRKKR